MNQNVRLKNVWRVIHLILKFELLYDYSFSHQICVKKWFHILMDYFKLCTVLNASSGYLMRNAWGEIHLHNYIGTAYNHKKSFWRLSAELKLNIAYCLAHSTGHLEICWIFQMLCKLSFHMCISSASGSKDYSTNPPRYVKFSWTGNINTERILPMINNGMKKFRISCFRSAS